VFRIYAFSAWPFLVPFVTWSNAIAHVSCCSACIYHSYAIAGRRAAIFKADLWYADNNHNLLPLPAAFDRHSKSYRMSSVTALNLPPAFAAQLTTFFAQKMRRGVVAAESATSNPDNLEAPWYEVYEVFLQKLLLSHPQFATCPQGTLHADLGHDARSRTPDFTIYRYIDQLLANNTVIIHSRIPRLLVEIKRAIQQPTPALAGRSFRGHEFMRQIRNQAKLAFASYPNLQGIFLLQCIGRFWRRGYITRVGTSPLHNHPGAPVANIQWGHIADITTPLSDAPDLNNMQGNVFFV
jgi:hypothetical protein